MKITRRTAIGAFGASLATGMGAGSTTSGGGATIVSLNWLGGKPPALPAGVTWGVPWPRGTVEKTQAFRLLSGQGRALPLQSWTLAYWPDGSVKWTAFSTVAGPEDAGPLQLSPGANETSTRRNSVSAKDSGAFIQVGTGAMECRIPRSGQSLLENLNIGGHEVVRSARLVCTLEDRSQLESAGVLLLESFTSDVRKVTIEGSGPVRATVRVDGVHKAQTGTREWLPFTVRFYFYAGQSNIRVVHSFVFDGDEQKDFIRGLGLIVDVPMREEVHNRHIRFSGEGDGLWAEALQPLIGRRPLGRPGSTYYSDQLAGKRVPNKETFEAAGQKLLTDWAVWDSYKLVQPNADGFTIQKRTNAKSCWIDAGAGKRASGLVFAGDVSGGLALGIRNFWQSHPAALEVGNATGELAEIRAWLWSPDCPAMDLRHYDTKAHDLDSSYEDVQPGFSTPFGVGRTSEFTFFPTAGVPSREETVQQAKIAALPPLPVCTPEYLHSASVLGIWSLPDRGTPYQQAVEDDLDAALNMYRKEVEQRHWYGFWDYGDVMHSYDPLRHVWRYDVGGFAWDNTELGTDLWLWYSFLRTGRADVFRMAEAMTRHTSEVDTYHLGRFAMLGSRHNVRHWGCGAKEARISQAAFRRPYYYLTADERTGDIMRSVIDADYKLLEIDPMRLASPLKDGKKFPARIRSGPDWLAYAGNWMTEWERTGDSKYKNKILAGMDSIAGSPYGFMTGPNAMYGYDPKTGKLFPLEPDPFGVYNLQTIQGGAEVAFELNELIEHPGWKKAWLEYCRLTNAPKDVVARDRKTGNEGSDGQYAGGGRLAAYAYRETGNAAFAKRATGGANGGYGMRPGMYDSRQVQGPDVLNPIVEVPRLSTNSVAQSSLMAIEVLQLCASHLRGTPG